MFSIEAIRAEVKELNILYLFEHRAQKRTHCIYCNCRLIKDHPQHRRTRDHVIPKVRLKGASHILRGQMFQLTTVICCYACNNLKGDMSLRQWLDWLKERRVKNRILIMQGIKRMMCN